MLRRRILLIEDEESISEPLAAALGREGFDVVTAATAADGRELFRAQAPDLVVLDVMLPGVDGFELTRRVRAAEAAEGRAPLPILMLTARDAVADRVAGLELGADDYLVKPFAFDELLARVRALLRRARPSDDEVLHFADLTLNATTRDVARGGRRIELTAKEYELLEFFLRHARQVLPRDLIFERVWGSDFLGDSNIIDVHVMRLRAKLEGGGEPRLIHTRRGAGYSLRQE